MTPKYSTNTDQDDATRWDSDNRYVMAQWSTNPFGGHRHRHETVKQRLVIEYTHDVGVDIRWEVRSDDSAKFDDEWQPVETIEVREYGARHDRQPEARWLK
jgi:hypothetical protein